MAIPAPFTDQQIADQLTRDGYYWYGNNGDTTIYYSFSSSLGYWWGNTGEYALNATQQAWAETALAMLSEMFDVTFVETGQPANTQFNPPVDVIQIVNDTNTGTYSASYTYGSGDIAMNTVVLDQTWSSNQAANLDYGSYGYMTMLHELLHSLGLEHPGAYDAGNGVPITYQNDAEFQQDTHRYTVMSYFNSYEDGSGAVFYDFVNGEYVYPRTPMVYDILAMTSGSFAGNFAGYGFNTTTRNTDTTYGYNATAGINEAYDFAAHGAPVLTIYDTGGTDTLDLSGDTVGMQRIINYDVNGVPISYTDITRTTTLIDLREGQYSSTHGMTYNIGIAFGTVIENAIGTQFNDTIQGNDADNALQGENGNDTIFGSGGNDRIWGGAGNDVLDAGAGTNWQYLYGEGGDDEYRYAKEDGRVFVHAGFEGAGDGTNDRVVFEDLNYSDITVAYYTYASGPNGIALRLMWDDGVSTGELRVGQQGQYIEAFEFADGTVMTWDEFLNPTITGTSGDDVLVGGGTNDTILGLEGNDRIWGGAGNDVLDAGAGTNWQYLYGEGGDDEYRYAKEDGRVFVHAGFEGAGDGTNDRVVFEDLNYSDITVAYYTYASGPNGTALRLMWDDGVSTGELRVGQQGQYIEAFEFADGTVMTWDEFLNPTITGTSGDDMLFGGETNDTILGLEGNDRIWGGAGNDVLDAGAGTNWQYLYGEGGDDEYRYAKEDGRVFVNAGFEGAGDGTNDRVVFEDLNYSDITVAYYTYASGPNGTALRLMWNDGVSTGEIRVGQQGQYIEAFEFADGTVMTWDEFLPA